MSDTQTDIHNHMAGKIVSDIVRPIVDAGGGTTQIMVLTESVLVGIALVCIKLGGDEVVLDTMLGGAKARLAEIRLKDLPTSGEG